MQNKLEMARRVALMGPNEFYPFPERPLLEELEDAAGGSVQTLPLKTLHDRQYQNQPLMIKPDYKGDFLERLRRTPDEEMERIMEKDSANEENLLDFSMPSELLKHQEEPHPRDLAPEDFERNKPDDEVGMKVLRDWYDRGWDPWDAPEMSEDKILRMRTEPHSPPLQNPVKGPIFRVARDVVYNFLNEICPRPDPKNVVGSFLIEDSPYVCLDTRTSKTAEFLNDFNRSLMYTKTKGWRKPEIAGVSARLIRADPKEGRWTFRTSSGGDQYQTIFQFAPNSSERDVTKVPVRVYCSCPSFLFWGAQYNAFTNNYLYTTPQFPIRPKLTPPAKRDPAGRFLVCKHILACIPIISNYKLPVLPKTVREKLKKAPKIYVKTKGLPKEKIRIPAELRHIARRPVIKKAIKDWDSMKPEERRDFITGLRAPAEVAFMGHRFPLTATEFVAEKLRDMAQDLPTPSLRRQASQFLRWFV